MKSRRTIADGILQLARAEGLLRIRDLTSRGLHPEILRRLCRQGHLDRVSRGLYALPNAAVSVHHALVQASKKVPAGVICLLSALQFHGLTTQLPFEVWVMIGSKARAPVSASVPLRIVRAAPDALNYACEGHRIEGARVRVTSPAKTVADCFKYRNKIGLDVALEALRDYQRQYKGGSDELWRAAKVCRVANVMRPYQEALT